MEPESLDLSDGFAEARKIDRLGDVGVGLQAIGPADVLLVIGGGQHHHRQTVEFRIGADRLQHFPAVHQGKVQVEQDQVRPEGLAEFTFAAQKCQGGRSIRNHVNIHMDLRCLHRFQGQFDIVRIVLHKQYLGVRQRCHVFHGRVSFPSAKRLEIADSGQVT